VIRLYERWRARVAALEQEGPVREAQRALLSLLDEIRSLAEHYATEDAGLVRPLRDALAKVVEKIVVHERGRPSQGCGEADGSRSVFLVTERHMLEIVARETAPTPVCLRDGSLVEADLPHFEPVALERADNASFASAIAPLSVRVLEALVASGKGRPAAERTQPRLSRPQRVRATLRSDTAAAT
jgi:hypothetical protein